MKIQLPSALNLLLCRFLIIHIAQFRITSIASSKKRYANMSPVQSVQKRASYRSNFTFPRLQMASTLEWFQSTPSTILDGCYTQRQIAAHLCICRALVPHYIPFCPLYTEPRNKFLAEILKGVHSPVVEKLIFLL